MSFPSPGDRPDPGIKPGSPALQADSLPSEPPGKSISTIFQLKKKERERIISEKVETRTLDKSLNKFFCGVQEGNEVVIGREYGEGVVKGFFLRVIGACFND